jgi:hypothetical protein
MKLLIKEILFLNPIQYLLSQHKESRLKWAKILPWGDKSNQCLIQEVRLGVSHLLRAHCALPWCGRSSTLASVQSASSFPCRKGVLGEIRVCCYEQGWLQLFIQHLQWLSNLVLRAGLHCLPSVRAPGSDESSAWDHGHGCAFSFPHMALLLDLSNVFPLG